MTEVLWITPGYPWSGSPVGGIFYRTQARALARLGISVTVAAPVPYAPWPLRVMRDRWRLYAEAPLRADDDGVSVIRPRYPNLPGQPRWARADRLIAQTVLRRRDEWSRASIIHGHAAIEGIVAWRLARQTGLPYVLTFHGSDINTWPGSHPDRVEDLRSAIRGAAEVIGVSQALAGRIRELAGREALGLPLGSDHEALRGRRIDRDLARMDLGIPQDRVVALFVGHLLRAKGVREFVDGIRAAGDPFVGIVVGAGPEAGYGLTDREPDGALRYTGELPHREAVRYMSAADVMVLPSHGEGLPTVLVEAGSLGLPVIATAVGGIPELLGTDRGTLLARPDAAALAQALRAFAADRAGAAAAAARLRAHVQREYDVVTNARRLLQCYHEASAQISSE